MGRRAVVVFAAFLTFVAALVLAWPRAAYFKTFPAVAGEDEWPVLATAAAPDDPEAEMTLAPFVQHASTTAVAIATLEHDTSLVGPARTPPDNIQGRMDFVGTSLHRQGHRYALIDWAQTPTSGFVSQRIVVFELVPRGLGLLRIRTTPIPVLLELAALVAAVLCVFALRLALPWFGRDGFATWDEGIVKDGIVRTPAGGEALRAPGVADGWVLFRPRNETARDPYRSLGHTADVTPGTRAQLAKRFHAHAIRAAAFAVFAVMAIAVSEIPFERLARVPGTPGTEEPLARAMPSSLLADMGKASAPGAELEIDLRAPLPACGPGSAVFYERASLGAEGSAGEVTLLRETLVNANAGACVVLEARMGATDLTKTYGRIQLNPFETRIRTESLHAPLHWRRLVLRSGTPSELVLDLWQSRAVPAPGLKPASRPPPVLAGDSAEKNPKGPVNWTRFHVDQRFPGVSACAGLADMVVDDVFVGHDYSTVSRAMWLVVDVAYLQATTELAKSTQCGGSGRPSVVLRHDDERRVAGERDSLAPRLGARITNRWTLSNGTRYVELALGGTDDDVLALDLEIGKATVVRSSPPRVLDNPGAVDLRAEWEARAKNPKLYVARRLIRAIPWADESVAEVERAPLHVLCTSGVRDDYATREELLRGPVTILAAEACR